MTPTGLRSSRKCTPELWHIYHGKTKWHESFDGMHQEKSWEAKRAAAAQGPVDYATSRDWVLSYVTDGAEVLYRDNRLKDSRCQ